MRKFFSFYNIGSKYIQVLVHLENPESGKVFERMIKEINDTENQSPIIIIPNKFNVFQLIAERHFDLYPLYKGYERQLRETKGQGLNLLFIGFGKVNQHLAFHALHIAHYITEEPITLNILDKDAERVEKEWRALAKNYEKVAKVFFHSFDVEKESLRDKTLTMKNNVTHIFVSLKDDFLDMAEGIDLVEIYEYTPIFIKMKEGRLVSEWLDNQGDSFQTIKRYPFYYEVLSSSNVLKEPLDKLAKEAHQKYQLMKFNYNVKDIDKDWSSLTEFSRESNRYQMVHNRTKIMLLGLETVPMDRENPLILSQQEYKEYITPHIDKLAEVEHKRWNAFHYLRGWQTNINFELTKPIDYEKKLHNCLVTWEELERVSLKVKGCKDCYKNYDRNNIEYLRMFYEAQHLGLVQNNRDK